MTYAWFDVVVPCICLRAIWHMHGSMWRATWMTRDRKRIIVAHCVIALWRHYCRGCVEGHFSGYPSHKTYTCQYITDWSQLSYVWYLDKIKYKYKYTDKHKSARTHFIELHQLVLCWHMQANGWTWQRQKGLFATMQIHIKIKIYKNHNFTLCFVHV